MKNVFICYGWPVEKIFVPYKMIISIIFLVLPFMPVGTNAESGQEFEIASTGEMAEEMLLFQEIPSVYSASKYEQKVTEAPSSVSIITAEEIKKYGHRTLSDVLRSVRGFYTTNDRNYEYLGARGFLRPGDYNTKFLLLIDGHRVNDAIYDSFGFGGDFIVDIDIVDRIEVIRGPGSAIYGTSAFFGVINIISKKGRHLKGFDVSAVAGDRERYKGIISYGNRFGSGLEMFLSASYLDSEGDDSLFFKEFNDPLTNNGIAKDSDDMRFSNLFAEFSFADFTLQGAYNSYYKKIPTAPWGTFFNSQQNTEDSLAYIDLKFDHDFSNDLNFMARANYNYYWYDGVYVYDWNEDPADPYVVPNDDTARGEWIQLEMNLTKKFLDKHTLVVGGEHRNNLRMDQYNADVDSNVVPTETFVYLDDHQNSDYYGLFGQVELKLSKMLTLFGGVRYDHFETFGGTTNPRLALVVTPHEKTVFKFLYGEAFRAPNAYELYYHDTGVSTNANPNLDPETIETFEVVYEQYIGDHLRFVADGFYYEIDDLISLIDDPNDPGIVIFENVEKVEAYGLEFEVEGKWASGFEGRASWAYQENEDKQTSDILTNSPKHLGKLNVTIPILKDKIFAGPEVQYVSRRKTKPAGLAMFEEEAGSYVVTNLTLFSKNLVEDLELSGTVYNLFDKNVGDVASAEHTQDIIVQDGRTFRVKVTYSF